MSISNTRKDNIPIRKIQKFLYCPRQYYLECVLNIPLDPTVEVVEGKLIHNRIESREYRSRKRKTLGVSMWLSSEELGIRGIIDLVELTDHNSVIPVEFRRDCKKAFQSDLIGLTAYAYCLEERNYNISHLEIYSHKHRSRFSYPYTIRLKKKLEEVISQIRGHEFPKTENKNKCDKCANKRICWSSKLNFEINMEVLQNE